MIKSLRSVFLALFVAVQFVVYGQPAERLIQVLVTPDHTNWLYQPGEKVKFKDSCTENAIFHRIIWKCVMRFRKI